MLMVVGQKQVLQWDALLHDFRSWASKLQSLRDGRGWLGPAQASNARYRSAVGTQPHGTACMAALGFAPVFEASEEVLTTIPYHHPTCQQDHCARTTIKAMANAHLQHFSGQSARYIFRSHI